MSDRRVCDWPGCEENREESMLYCERHLGAEIDRWLADSGYPGRVGREVTIGSIDVARLCASDGRPMLARIHMLTPGQAVSALAYLSGFAPEATSKAIRHATGVPVPESTEEEL